MGKYALQVDELHHPEDPQLDNQFSIPSSCNHLLEDSSLEDTLKAFIQSNSQILQEIKDATMANSQPIHEINDMAMANMEAIARLEGQLGHLVAEFSRIEEEGLQSQEMVHGDESSNSYHEHVQATSTLGNEEIVKEIFC